MPETINGLPTHPLVVHFSVVLALLAALLGILFAIPRTRRWAAWALPLVSFGALVATWVAKESGEGLEHRVEAGVGTARWEGTALERIVDQHAELADLMFMIMLAFTVVAVIAFLLWRRSDRGLTDTPAVVVSLLLLVGAVGIGVQMYRVGDAGAKAVWQETVPLAPVGAGGGDDDESAVPAVRPGGIALR